MLQAQPFTWAGEMSRESVLILAQHAVQGKLTGADTALARWLVFCHTHSDLPLGDTPLTVTWGILNFVIHPRAISFLNVPTRRNQFISIRFCKCESASQ